MNTCVAIKANQTRDQNNTRETQTTQKHATNVPTLAIMTWLVGAHARYARIKHNNNSLIWNATTAATHRTTSPHIQPLHTTHKHHHFPRCHDCYITSHHITPQSTIANKHHTPELCKNNINVMRSTQRHIMELWRSNNINSTWTKNQPTSMANQNNFIMLYCLRDNGSADSPHSHATASHSEAHQWNKNKLHLKKNMLNTNNRTIEWAPSHTSRSPWTISTT